MAESSVSCSSQSTFVDRKSSDSSSENTVTPNHSSPSSTENYVPSRTCDWTRSLIDKLGLRYECKQPLEIVMKHMANLAHLFPDEVDALEEVANKLGCRLGCVGYFNCESLINIPVHGLCFLDQIDICLLQRNIPFEEIDMIQQVRNTSPI
ncbi:uncharacterized protein LOC125661371 [Ostrea edulis]|uniref:uncharacterized protein LOC125661371 n=1 Tax=Ostrea edulis TaxID=37623 RepID=UPI0024AFF016|nr:uncharacterized protein LOC125661371 [Ostrea edulis]